MKDHNNLEPKDFPAFPFVSHGSVSQHQACYPGMAIRDYIATHIMAGMNACLSDTASWPTEDGIKVMAENAYAQADGLLAAREAK